MPNDMMNCPHPPEQRWQNRDTWRCGCCNADFWGDKRESPTADIYGRTAHSVNRASFERFVGVLMIQEA